MSDESLRAISALDDPQRHRLYGFVRAAAAPVTREEAAAATSISRKLAAFHLDRLVDAGLLEVSLDRPSGAAARIGRTPRRYKVSGREVAVSIPERHYDFVGELLLDAFESVRAGASPDDAVREVARGRGMAVGTAVREERRLGRLGAERAAGVVIDVLADFGFEPVTTAEGIVQRNCPFHRLADRAPELVCGMNVAFAEGLLEGLGAPRLSARLAPAPGRCCVVVATEEPLR